MEAHKALLNPELRDNTLADLLDRYIGEWPGKDISTVGRLAWWRENHGNHALAEFTGDTVREGLERLRNGKVHRHQQGRGVTETAKQRTPATINRYLAAVDGAFRVGMVRGWYGLKENPARGIGRMAEKNDRNGRLLNETEREALLQACDASPSKGLGLIVRLALSTGMRRGEIMGLRWCDVDLAEGLVRLRETKNTDPRLVPLVPDTQRRLADWAKVRRIDTDLVFPSPRNPPHPVDFTSSWNVALEQADIENFRFHDCRHSAASFLTDAGVNHVVIAEILGHRTLAMVKRYSHAGLEAKRKALTDALSGKLG